MTARRRDDVTTTDPVTDRRRRHRDDRRRTAASAAHRQHLQHDDRRRSPSTRRSAATRRSSSRPFSPDSPWNTQVAGDRVDKNSRRWIKQSRIRVANAVDDNSQDTTSTTSQQHEPGAEEHQGLRDGQQLASAAVAATRRNGRAAASTTAADEDSSNCRTINAGLTINVTKWTDPVFSNAQDGAIERIAICRQFNCGADAVSSIVIPPDACPDPRYDGWMTVIDNDSRTALDFWRARCENDGSISYHYVKKWDLDGPGFQKPNGVSARGSGLPLFAGLITPEEIRDGEINHALAISVPGAATRRYVQPASRTDGTGLVTSIPEGARMRLKPGAEKALTKRFVRNKDQRRRRGRSSPRSSATARSSSTARRRRPCTRRRTPTGPTSCRST